MFVCALSLRNALARVPLNTSAMEREMRQVLGPQSLTACTQFWWRSWFLVVCLTTPPMPSKRKQTDGCLFTWKLTRTTQSCWTFKFANTNTLKYVISYTCAFHYGAWNKNKYETWDIFNRNRILHLPPPIFQILWPIHSSTRTGFLVTQNRGGPKKMSFANRPTFQKVGQSFVPADTSCSFQKVVWVSGCSVRFVCWCAGRSSCAATKQKFKSVKLILAKSSRMFDLLELVSSQLERWVDPKKECLPNLTSANFQNLLSKTLFGQLAEIERSFGSTHLSHLSSCKETNSSKSNILDDFARISFTFLKSMFVVRGKTFPRSRKPKCAQQLLTHPPFERWVGQSILE